MSVTARVVAQAKINLVLRVLAREDSGFHSLETVFLRLDLGDDVSVRITDGRSLDCAGPSIPPGGLGPVERNLAYRAAVAYADSTGWPRGFAVEVVKRIPVGGGLGGGSADAGAVLRALDALAPNPVGSRLVEMAASLGADVPFMTIDSPMALAWGRGERLFPLPPLATRPVALIVPDFRVGTAEAFGWLAAARSGYSPTGWVVRPDSLVTWTSAAAIATNDFQRVVAARHPVIGELVDELKSCGAMISMLSGSGSTVFGIFDQSPDWAAITRQTGLTTVATRTSGRVVGVTLDQ
jgi:4-diphosphocytidyl-2-C-methyl-D-erythritol kinase